MRVVSDTSPLLNLAIIGELRLLRLQFGEIVMPPAVAAELQLDSSRPGSAALSEAVAAGWIRTVVVGDQVLARSLLHELDPGEAEALALATQLQADLVLMDESEGRAAARRLGLRTVGVVGVLLRAKRNGTIASVAVALGALIHEAHFRHSDDLIHTVLTEAGELPRPEDAQT
jgi:hypothetical protein